jgi:lysophospholipase L1-like esterase
MSKPPTQVIGDSLTWHGKPHLAAIKPAWGIDGVRGRQANMLIPRIQAFYDTWGSMPKHLVIALGTNEEGATREMYQEACDMLPAANTVLFVTCYRDPAVFGQARADKMEEISGWMAAIKNSRPNTCLVPWRNKVLNNPELLEDGVHCTPAGEKVWAKMVADNMDACVA